MIDHFYKVGTVAFDTETCSEDFGRYPEGALRKMSMQCDLASFATPDFRAWVVPIGMLTVQGMKADEFFPLIKGPMEDEGLLKLAWNFSFDAALFANYDVWISCYEDVMVKAHALDENKGAGLKERCADGGMTLRPYDFKSYWKARHLYRTMACDKKGNPKVLLNDLAPMEAEYVTYSGEDAMATVVLNPIYDAELDQNQKLKDMSHRLLNPSVRTIFNMERRGVPIDPVYLRVIERTCRDDMDAAERKVYATAGKHFNLGSTKDLGEVLYKDLGMPVFKTTEKGANSTDKATLEALGEAGYPIAIELLRHRRLAKLHGTYLDPQSGLRAAAYDWGCIHPNYNLTGTVTGRLSSNGPNIQQIPRSIPRTYNIRKSFIPHKGYRLVGGDQSQVELRVMAHMSGDQNMVEEYCKDEPLWRALNEGRDIAGLSKSDIHQRTATACNCHRNTAKNINFGLLYGMFAKKLAGILTSVNFQNCLKKGTHFDPLSDVVTPELAEEFITAFFNMYPGIRGYQDYISQKAKAQGYIETRYGRRRRLPDIYSGDRYLVLGACRQAINTTIQGHVGEMMLLSMCKADNTIDNPDGRALRKLGYRLFMQVHDEVLGECPDNDQTVQDVKHHLTRIFQNPGACTAAYPYAGYRVPLIFEAQEGPNWHEVH
uniref:DNA-directed DNA polymerase family A palm domain-containing protein n=1 Tax=Biomphalaria glabrata TaxID=6526 RepID=A0A2C9M659_BIOGL